MAETLRQLFLEHVGQTSESPMMLEIERAQGVYLYSPCGKRYIDLISGVSVSNVGHGNQNVVEAICAQTRSHTHLMVYGEVVQGAQVNYAARLAELLPPQLQSVYFVNSGSEAVEGALKLAKRYTSRTELASFRNAYHGSSHGALSVMGSESYRHAFRPLLPDTRILNFNSVADLEQITTRTAAVIIEPIQGEGGFVVPEKGFLEALRKRCTDTGTVLIFDEIQTGMGRTGSLYAFMNMGVTPDILCTAKAFGGGMPLGAFISSNEIMNSLKTNPILGHITTFGGHPVSCAAGLAALEYILDRDLMSQVESKSELYRKLLSDHPLVKEIRGKGLMLAVEFGDFSLNQKIVFEAVELGLLTEWFLFCDTSLRIAPPLTITTDEIRESCTLLRKAMDKFL